ncbi:MAG: DNA primase [Flavobacteriaceae bacterium]|nr:DNA primase [Flavobacteriaceae bacterium]
MQNRIELVVLKHLLNEEDYARRTLPYLKSEYFSEMNERVIYQEIDKYLSQYNALPTKEALLIELDNNTKVSDENFSTCSQMISELQPDTNTDKEWLIEKTEKFCQEKAIYNAIMESISIIDGKDKQDTGTIPELLSDALSVSFDPSIGHDFIDDSDSRWDFYHRIEERVPFDLDYLNKITKGGVPKKSLNIILAGTGVGKSLAMCHMASANLLDGKNVLYVTMEMAEEKIAERIDANLLNVSLEDLANLPKQMYDKKLDRVKGKTSGKLIVKEYPTASAHVGHFRHLLNELRLKRQFMPDIIYVDYLNICMSHRIRTGSNVNSYTLIKSIAEELRGLAVEKNVPIISATQTTRSGFTNSDLGLEDTSESFGLPATADFMFALISTEELEDLNQIMIKQLKNRYNDPTLHKRFVVGVDRAKMRLYDVEQSAQDDVLDGPVFDNTTYAKRADEDDKMKWATKKIGKKDFAGLKV